MVERRGRRTVFSSGRRFVLELSRDPFQGCRRVALTASSVEEDPRATRTISAFAITAP